MRRLLISIASVAAIAAAGCNSQKNGPEASATDSAVTSDADAGMGGAMASDSAMTGAPTDMATTSKSELDYRPSYLAASIAGALVFLLYIITLAPSTGSSSNSQ